MAITYTTSGERVNWPDLVRDLERDDFHNGRTSDELARSFDNSYAVAFAWHAGRVVGTARALSDGVCNAYVVDVWTETPFRRQGVGRALMARLEAQLDGQHVYLFTDTAGDFYANLSYVGRGIGLEKVVGRWLGRFDPKPPG